MNRLIGAQYYTIRKTVKTIEDFDVACRKVSEIGYRIVQISGMSLQANEMREVLDNYDLKAITSHRNFKDFLTNLDEVIDYNKTLGIDLCGIGAMPSECRASADNMKQFIKEANKVCEILKKENMYLGYHNHSFEFANLDGNVTFDSLVEDTNPEVFCFILDTYWLQMGGKTPQDVIRSLGKRAQVVHFKDFAIDANEWKVPRMTEVGRGNLDWDAIIEACQTAGVQYAIVEQDENHIDDDPFQSLAVSYNFLQTKGFY